jgi:hypothetical protein
VSDYKSICTGRMLTRLLQAAQPLSSQLFIVGQWPDCLLLVVFFVNVYCAVCLSFENLGLIIVLYTYQSENSEINLITSKSLFILN